MQAQIAPAAEQKQDAPFRPSELHPWSTFRIDHGVIGRIDPALDWGYTFPHSLYRRTYEVLAGVSPKGDKLQLTFDQQSWDQVILDCVDTDKIDQIRPDGKVIYRRRCTRAGVEHRQHQEPPIEIDAGAGGGLKPGMFIELIVYTNPREAKTEGAFVAEAYASAKRERLVFFAGIPVP